MPADNRQIEMMARLTTGLENLATIVNELREDARRLAGDRQHAADRIAVIEGRIVHMAGDVDVLLRVVRDGNGQASMLSRVGVLEEVCRTIKSEAEKDRKNNHEAVADVETKLDDDRRRNKEYHSKLEDRVEVLENKNDEQKTAVIVTRGQVITGVAGVLVAALMALSAWIMHFVKGKD